jgi:hypothetical protein
MCLVFFLFNCYIIFFMWCVALFSPYCDKQSSQLHIAAMLLFFHQHAASAKSMHSKVGEGVCVYLVAALESEGTERGALDPSGGAGERIVAAGAHLPHTICIKLGKDCQRATGAAVVCARVFMDEVALQNSCAPACLPAFFPTFVR